MTVRELLRSVMRSLGEDYNDADSRDVFLGFLVEVVELILSDNEDWGFNFGKEPLTTVSGTHTYLLSGTLDTIVSMVEKSTDRSLTQVSIEQLAGRGFDLEQTGEPRHFILYGISDGALGVRLWPVPSSARTYDVFRTVQPSSLSITDTLPVPRSMVQTLKLGIRMFYYENGENSPMVDRLRRAFMESLSNMRGRHAHSRARRTRLGVSDIPHSHGGWADAQLPGDYPRI